MTDKKKEAEKELYHMAYDLCDWCFTNYKVDEEVADFWGMMISSGVEGPAMLDLTITLLHSAINPPSGKR